MDTNNLPNLEEVRDEETQNQLETEQSESVENINSGEKDFSKKMESIEKQLGYITRHINKNNTEKSISNESNQSVSDKDYLELRLQGYSQDEINFVMKNGGIESLKDPIVKKVLDEKVEQRKAEDAQFTGSGNSPTIISKYSEKDIEKMSAEEYAEKVLGEK